MLEVVVAGLAVLDALALERLPASDQPAEGGLPDQVIFRRLKTFIYMAIEIRASAYLALMPIFVACSWKVAEHRLYFSSFTLRPSVKNPKVWTGRVMMVISWVLFLFIANQTHIAVK